MFVRTGTLGEARAFRATLQEPSRRIGWNMYDHESCMSRCHRQIWRIKETRGNQVCWCFVKTWEDMWEVLKEVMGCAPSWRWLLPLPVPRCESAAWNQKELQDLHPHWHEECYDVLSVSPQWCEFPRPKAAESLNAWHVDGTFYAVATHCGAWCWEGQRGKECCRHPTPWNLNMLNSIYVSRWKHWCVWMKAKFQLSTLGCIW